MSRAAAHARSRLRQEGSEVQTVIAGKDRFGTVGEARTWVSDHGFRTDKVDVTDSSYRFRQFDPGECSEGALGNGETFATITLDRGVKAVVCKKAGRAVDNLERAFPGDVMRHADFAVEAREVSLQEVRERGYQPGEDEAKHRLYEVAISSEAEVERWFGIEILGHAAGEIDMERIARGAAVLVGHGGDQVGVVLPGSARVDPDKVLRAYVRFSRSQRGREIEDDVAEGIRTSTSVGYFVKEARLVGSREVGTDERGRAVTVDVYRATRWQPAEVSLVSVPADVTVGVGRSATETTSGGGAAKGRSKMETREEINEILEMAEFNHMEPKQVRQWIAEGLTAEQVGLRIVQARKTTGEGQPAAEVLAALSDRDRHAYSYRRAILVAAGEETGGLETEVHRELERKQPVGIKRRAGGLLLPLDLRSADQRYMDLQVRQALMTRGLDSKVAGKGMESVVEMAGEFIDLLRVTAVTTRLGARVLAGLTGPVAFPKQSGPMTTFWVGENPSTDVTASDVAFGLVNLAPKTLQATTAFSRQLLVQSSIDIEAMVRIELATIHGLALDRAAIHGKGAAGEPTGIYLAPDVNVRAVGGQPDYADVMEAIGLVADDNALAGGLGWATTPLMAARLRQIPEHPTGTMANWLWQGTLQEGTLGGYRAIASNQISKTMLGSAETGGTEHGAIFGNWGDLVIGTFASLELIVDPFALKKRGMIELTSFQMLDLVLRHGESFCKWTGATTP